MKINFNRRLIVELKIGPIKDEHIGQLLAYEGFLLSEDSPNIRIMLIGNRVPPNLQKSLDFHGIAWKEFSYSSLISFLKSKNDIELVKIFNSNEVQDLNYKNLIDVKHDKSIWINTINSFEFNEEDFSSLVYRSTKDENLENQRIKRLHVLNEKIRNLESDLWNQFGQFNFQFKNLER